MAQAIADGVFYTGVNDYTSDLFEGIWPIPNGVSINSYIVKGEKTALIDIVKSTGGGSSQSLFSSLKTINLKNFRKYKHLTVEFKKGLNVLIGENDSGKTAIVDAIRYILNTNSLPDTFYSLKTKKLFENTCSFCKL